MELDLYLNIFFSQSEVLQAKSYYFEIILVRITADEK